MQPAAHRSSVSDPSEELTVDEMVTLTGAVTCGKQYWRVVTDCGNIVYGNFAVGECEKYRVVATSSPLRVQL